jgi:hypothetical protein
MAIISHSPKDSSHIRSFSYDDHSKVMSVIFAHDRLNEPKVYHHSGVPLEIFNAWLKWSAAGHSAGSYYHRFVSKYKILKDELK